MKIQSFVLLLALSLFVSVSRAAQTVYASVIINQNVPTSSFTTYQTIPITTTVPGFIQVQTEVNGGNPSNFRIQIDGVTVGSSGASTNSGAYVIHINGQSAELPPGNYTVTIQAQGTAGNAQVGGFSTIVTLPSEPDPEVAIQLQQFSELLDQINASIQAGNTATVAQLQSLQTLLTTQFSQIQKRLDSIVTNTSNSSTTTTTAGTTTDPALLTAMLMATQKKHKDFWEKNAGYMIVGGGVIGGAVIIKCLNPSRPAPPTEARPGYYEN